MTIIAANSPGELEGLFAQLTVNDTNVVRVATTKLKKVLSKVACVSNLLCLLTTNVNVATRHMSAVYLRKKIGQHWIKLKAPEKQQCQQLLMDALIKETERSVKNGIAGIISVLAKYTLPQNQWQTLLPFLQQLSQNNNALLRELAMRVFRILLSSLGKTMRVHLGVLRHIFQSGLEDPVLNVKLEALKSLSAMAAFLDDPASLAWFQTILAPMLATLSACVTADGESDAAMAALEVLEELADNPKDILQAQLAQILSSIVAIAANPNVEMDIRERSACLISTVVGHRAACIMESLPLVDQLIGASMTILLESCTAAVANGSSDEEEDEDDFSANCRGLAVQILDPCVLNLPNVATYPRVMSSVTAFMCGANGCPASRRAALFALMVSVEGAALTMKKDFDSILNVVLQGLGDQDPGVREAACLAIGQLSDHMTDSMSLNHRRVIEAMIGCMDHPTSNISVKRKLCLATEAICMEIDAGSCVDYAPHLMQRLFNLMQSHSTDIPLLESCIAAVAAVAKNIGVAFNPFFEQTITFLHSAMQSRDENHTTLRASAMQCMGAVLLSTGNKGPCAPLMQLSVEAYRSVDDPAVREAAFHFWSQISTLLGEEFTPYMETTIQLALEVIDSEEGMNYRSNKADLNAEFGGQSSDDCDDVIEECEDDEESLDETDAAGDDDDVGEDSDDDQRYHCSILSGYLDEKVAAIDCLTSIARFSGPSIIPYFDRILDNFEISAEYPHENVRLVVVKGMHDIVIKARDLWASNTPQIVHARVQALIDRVLPILLVLTSDDESRDVVASCLDATLSIVLKYKEECVSVFAEHRDDIVRCITLVLELKTEADKYRLADSEKDSVMDSCCDLIGGLGQAFLGSFLSMLQQLLPCLGQRFQAGDPLTQALIIGALGEVAEAMQATMAPYVAQILPIAMQAISSDEARLRRNAAFCAGACFTFADIDAPTAGHYVSHLTTLAAQLSQTNIDSNDEAALAARDNVCSALCKLVSGPSAARCTYDVATLFQLVSLHCPLRVDMDECAYVYPTLVSLWSRLTDQAAALPIMVPLMATILTDARVDNDLKGKLAPTLQQTLRQFGSAINMAQLSAEQQSVCQHLLLQ